MDGAQKNVSIKGITSIVGEWLSGLHYILDGPNLIEKPYKEVQMFQEQNSVLVDLKKESRGPVRSTNCGPPLGACPL